MFALLHSYLPDPIALSIGSFNLRWYGLFAAIGLASAWYVIERLRKGYAIREDLFPLFSGAVVSGLVGARLYHVINEIGYYAEHPIQIAYIWSGGLALHGGIIGAVLYAWWWVRKHNLSFPRLLDIFATGGILIQIFGRFGNYFNQELYGKVTDVPWSIPILNSDGISISYHHPTFLYEALLNTILFIILIALHRLTLHGKIRPSTGTIFSIYLICYSFIRIVIELIRIDSTPSIFDIRLPIIVSGIIIIGTLIYLALRHAYKQAHHS